MPLPKLMVAPNGARRTKADHPGLPIELAELVATAKACHAEGAQGIHLHVRDHEGLHSLDVGQYQDIMNAIKDALPDFFVQVTSESAGRFDPQQQMQMIRTLRPASVSLALSELQAGASPDTLRAFYHDARDARVTIHHIVYTPEQLRTFLSHVDEGIVPGTSHQLQLVLGSYAGTEPSRPNELAGYKTHIDARPDLQLDWMICAFGPAETECLVEAARQGGKMRIGFENSLWNADGSLAKDNAARVRELVASLAAAGQTLSPDDK